MQKHYKHLEFAVDNNKDLEPELSNPITIISVSLTLCPTSPFMEQSICLNITVNVRLKTIGAHCSHHLVSL